MRKLGIFLLALAVAFTNLPARAAMPPHGPYAKGCHPDDVRAVTHSGVRIAFDCFSSTTAMSAIYGARMMFAPDEERYSTGGASTSTMQIFVSADPGCPTPRDGNTYALTGPCILVEGTSVPGGLTYVSTCSYKSKSPAMRMFMQACGAGMRSINTGGTITFSHWSDKPGGRLAFAFSSGARLTEFVQDLKAPNGMSAHTMRISGSATVTLL